MKLAILSNLYPPRFIGGYEIVAARAAAELRRLGHEVQILSCHWYHTQRPDGFARIEQPLSARRDILSVGPYLHGSLVQFARSSPAGFVDAFVTAQLARRRYLTALRRFQPEAVWVFNPACLFAPVLEDLEALAAEIGFSFNAYLTDSWLADWPAPSLVRVELWDKLASKIPFLRRPIRRLADRLGYRENYVPGFDRIAFSGKYMQRVNRPNIVGDPVLRIIPCAVSGVADRVPLPPERFTGTSPLAIVYVGQVATHKGLHVLIDALARTKRRHRLSIIGDDANPYGQTCREQVARLGLNERVRFVGKVPAEEVADATRAAGEVLVLPSVWQEPYSLVVLEGMALGLVVLASDTGGTAEAFLNGQEAFLFPRGDSDALASLIDCVEADRALAARVSAAARREALRSHTQERMVSRLLEHSVGDVARLRAA